MKHISKEKKSIADVPRVPMTQRILEALLEYGVGLLELVPIFETPYEHTRRLRGISPVYYRQTLKRFEKRGWVTRSQKEGQTFFTLTKKGKVAALFEKLITESQRAPRASKRCLVLFDIPERCRKDRDALRGILYMLEFEQVQKSVYVGCMPSEAVRAYLQESGLEKYIRCFTVKEEVAPVIIKKQHGTYSRS